MHRTHSVFHMSLLEPYHSNDIPDRDIVSPPPIEIEDELEYEVESIVDSRIHYCQLQYKIKWQSYPDTEWEPYHYIVHCQELVDDFHTRYPDKPGPFVAPDARS